MCACAAGSGAAPASQERDGELCVFELLPRALLAAMLPFEVDNLRALVALVQTRLATRRLQEGLGFVGQRAAGGRGQAQAHLDSPIASAVELEEDQALEAALRMDLSIALADMAALLVALRARTVGEATSADPGPLGGNEGQALCQSELEQLTARLAEVRAEASELELLNDAGVLAAVPSEHAAQARAGVSQLGAELTDVVADLRAAKESLVSRTWLEGSWAADEAQALGWIDGGRRRASELSLGVRGECEALMPQVRTLVRRSKEVLEPGRLLADEASWRASAEAAAERTEELMEEASLQEQLAADEAGEVGAWLEARRSARERLAEVREEEAERLCVRASWMRERAELRHWGASLRSAEGAESESRREADVLEQHACVLRESATQRSSELASERGEAACLWGCELREGRQRLAAAERAAKTAEEDRRRVAMLQGRGAELRRELAASSEEAHAARRMASEAARGAAAARSRSVSVREALRSEARAVQELEKEEAEWQAKEFQQGRARRALLEEASREGTAKLAEEVEAEAEAARKAGELAGRLRAKLRERQAMLRHVRLQQRTGHGPRPQSLSGSLDQGTELEDADDDWRRRCEARLEASLRKREAQVEVLHSERLLEARQEVARLREEEACLEEAKHSGTAEAASKQLVARLGKTEQNVSNA